MKGDFSRVSFRRDRHVRGVLMQQGRVQLDADWNELQAVQSHRVETETIDVLGAGAVPKLDNGFQLTLTAPDQLTVGAGRSYVDGLLAENEAPVLVTDQPALPDYTLPDQPGLYVAFLDVHVRELTALQDDSIREVALGGRDTAIREAVVWQVKLLRVGDHDPGARCETLGEIAALLPRPRGALKARAEFGPSGVDPCNVAPDAAYRGVENQLYRVEIHQGGPAATATFKWSRENAATVAAWLPDNVGVNRVKVGDVGRDGLPGFRRNQWVELLDDTNELYDDTVAPQHDAFDPAGRPGALVQLDDVDDQVLVLKPDAQVPPRGARNPRVRAWDMPDGAIKLDQTTTDDGFIELENGVQVQFDQSATYTAGDHWLIEARTIIADIVWPQTAVGPQAKPPDGVDHQYAPLAVLTTADGQAWELLDDCRKLFPSLTGICAEDICFDDEACDLPGARTVQDALDRLCERTDLKHHNQHLHGWGIVCGLALRCGPDDEGAERKHVTVEPGYAIDAAGNDVNVLQEITVDVLDQVAVVKQRDGVDVLNDQGDGELCLLLDPDVEDGPIRAEKFDPKEREDRSLLAGTLLLDFYNDCVKPVHDFLREQLADDDSPPAGPKQQRRSALINLANQVVNPKSGQQVYISKREDQIIRAFYQGNPPEQPVGLRDLLTSETFCAMFENARPMPDYQLGDVRMDTIFGLGGHGRLRLRPPPSKDRIEAYTFGAGSDPLRPKALINRYDIDRGVLVAELDPVAGTQRTTAKKPPDKPAGAGNGPVLDVAFSPNGDRIHVAIASRNEDNTIFRSGTVTDDDIDWTPPVTICGMKLVSLATTAADPNVVYAVGLHKVKVGDPQGKVPQDRFEWQGLGLFRINPDQIDPNNVPQVTIAADFSPSGPLVIDASGRAVLAGTSPNTDATLYNLLLQVDLAPDPTNPAINWLANLELRGSDGIAFVTATDAQTPTQVFAVVDETGGAAKRIVGFRMSDGLPIVAPNPTQVSPTAIGLVGARGLLLVSEFDANSVRMIDPDTLAFVDGFRLPTQVGPAAIAATGAGQVVVLNQVSDTLTVIAPTVIRRDFIFPSNLLVDYRAAMLNAFSDLLGGFLQYLKDCLCDHFLVRCPQPTGDEKQQLGCVSIRGGQVYKICNFSGRRYVTTFPTIAYWLSLVPIQAVLTRAIEVFCCTVLPERFGRKSFPGSEDESEVGDDGLSMTTILQLIETAQSNDLFGSVRDQRSRVGVVRQTAALAMRSLRPRVPPPGGAVLPASAIIGQPADQVAATLEGRGVAVRRARFDPRLTVQTPGTVAGMFRSPQPGQEVMLCEEEGQVRFFSVAEPPPLVGRVQELERSMATRDEELKRLRGTVNTARRVLAEAEALSGQLDEARSELARRDQTLVELRQRLEALEQAPPAARRRRRDQT
jgi:hypothetical protein